MFITSGWLERESEREEGMNEMPVFGLVAKTGRAMTALTTFSSLCVYEYYESGSSNAMWRAMQDHRILMKC